MFVDVECRVLKSRRLSPDLSSVTVKRNADLESRVTELEAELSIWKQAYATALHNSEREAKTHTVQLAALNRQVASMDTFMVLYLSLILAIPLFNCSRLYSTDAKPAYTVCHRR